MRQNDLFCSTYLFWSRTYVGIKGKLKTLRKEYQLDVINSIQILTFTGGSF